MRGAHPHNSNHSSTFIRQVFITSYQCLVGYLFQICQGPSQPRNYLRYGNLGLLLVQSWHDVPAVLSL